MKKFLLAFAVVFLIVIAYLSLIILRPVNYPAVAAADSAAVRYWHLSTGSRIAYTFFNGSRGDSSAAIIYLHGGPGAGITRREKQTYRSFAQEGYDVYLYDQLGCGRSSRLKDISGYTVARHVADLKEIIGKTGKKKAVLIGQSWGSVLAVRFVAAYPALVEKIVIAAPIAIPPANTGWEKIKAPDSLRLRRPLFDGQLTRRVDLPLRARLAYYLARKYSFKLMDDKEADALATWQTDELNRKMVCDSSNAVAAEGTEGYYVQLITAKNQAKLADDRAKLRMLNTPVLVMKAQCDNQVWGYTAEYLDIFRNHRFVLLKDAGHNAWLEQTQKYSAEILRFLNER